MNIIIIPFVIAAMSTIASAQQFGGAVRFYFSSPGGDYSRIFQDTVTSSSWAAEYDIMIENTSGHDIAFRGASVMIGYGKSTEFGEIATPISGTDTIRERFAFSGNPTFANNPNITWIAPWVADFSARSRMYGGYSQPLSGPIRPWGLFAGASNSTGFTKTIHAGEILPFFRIALRDNGLFASQSTNSVHLFNFPLQAGGSSSLFSGDTTTLYYYDNQNYFENSKLVLAAPEPAMSAAFLIAGIGLAIATRHRSRGQQVQQSSSPRA